LLTSGDQVDGNELLAKPGGLLPSGFDEEGDRAWSEGGDRLAHRGDGRHVARHRDPALAEHSHEPHGDLVGGGEDRRPLAVAVGEPFGGGTEGAGVVAAPRRNFGRRRVGGETGAAAVEAAPAATR
jgi:hypothetical protein